MKSGPATGAALKAAYQAQLDGEFSDVAGGEQWLQSYLATASTQTPDAEPINLGKLTRAERKAAACALLRQHPDWSNQRLAQAVRMSKNSIAEFRVVLEAAGQIEHYETLEGADGKAYPRFLDSSRTDESQAKPVDIAPKSAVSDSGEDFVYPLGWDAADRDLAAFPALRALPRWPASQLAYRVPTGGLSGNERTRLTGADLVRYEREEQGNSNNNGVSAAVEAELAKFPANRVYWVCRTLDDVRRYTDDDSLRDTDSRPSEPFDTGWQDQVMSLAPTNCPILGEDGDGGFLVLLPVAWHG